MHTHTAVSSEHTHCEHTPGAVGSHCSSARGAIGGSVPCSKTPQSWYWGWREHWLITLPTNNPCRTWDSNPQPLDYKSNSLTIRPRIPHSLMRSYVLRWLATNNLTRSQTHNFTIDCFSNLQGNLVGFAKHLILKYGSVPSLFGPSDSTESQPVSMINNRFKIWKYGNGRIVSNKRCTR